MYPIESYELLLEELNQFHNMIVYTIGVIDKLLKDPEAVNKEQLKGERQGYLFMLTHIKRRKALVVGMLNRSPY